MRSRAPIAALLAVVVLGCGSTTNPPKDPKNDGHEASPSAQPSGSAAPDPAAPTASASATPSAAASTPRPPVGPNPEVPEPERIAVSPELQAIVDAYDRLATDKAQDPGRQPAMTLSFFGVAPGQKVAELAPGEGYFTELLARAVGESGKVFGVNPKKSIEAYGDKWKARLERAFCKPVVRVDRELDAPFPPEAKDLDAVYIFLSYHDLYWLGVDRAAMNKAIFAALKPGGVYGVIDHIAKKGDGANDVKTLHRIEPSEVRADIEKAGFVFDSEATFLRNPRDTKDWSSNDTTNHGSTDRFVYRFKRP